MKKLNNKGFAISTMLYGILTMIILVFTLLLNIMRASYNKENAAVDNITYYLNKCVSKQVALEECYQSYDDDPLNPRNCKEEYEAYTSCVGKSSSLGNSSSNTIRLTDLAISLMDTSGLKQDTTVTTGKRYVYSGSSPHNYIKYGNRMGRIISIEPDNKIKIVFTDPFQAQFDKDTLTAENGKVAWAKTKMLNTITKEGNGISYSDKFVYGTFNTAIIYTSSSISDTLNTIKSEYTTEYKYGLITVADYVKASNSSSCEITSTTKTTDEILKSCSNNNWLKRNTCTWTMTGVVQSGEISYIAVNGTSYDVNSVTTSCQTEIVTHLSAVTSVGITGKGTQSEPFNVTLE